MFHIFFTKILSFQFRPRAFWKVYLYLFRNFTEDSRFIRCVSYMASVIWRFEPEVKKNNLLYRSFLFLNLRLLISKNLKSFKYKTYEWKGFNLFFKFYWKNFSRKNLKALDKLSFGTFFSASECTNNSTKNLKKLLSFMKTSRKLKCWLQNLQNLF